MSGDDDDISVVASSAMSGDDDDVSVVASSATSALPSAYFFTRKRKRQLGKGKVPTFEIEAEGGAHVQLTLGQPRITLVQSYLATGVDALTEAMTGRYPNMLLSLYLERSSPMGNFRR